MDPNKKKEPEYKLGDKNLEVLNDLNFVRNILKDLDVDSEPQARGVLLDLAYTLARDHLVEADKYAKMENRTNITVGDINMSKQVHVRKMPRPPTPDEDPEDACQPPPAKAKQVPVKKMAKPPPPAKDPKPEAGKQVLMKKMAKSPPPAKDPKPEAGKQVPVKKMAKPPPPAKS